jgi:hypothetical protein
MVAKKESTDNSHAKCLDKLSKFQAAEKDVRDAIRETQEFLYEPDGQWDDAAIKIFKGKYRGTFDRIYPVISSIVSEIQERDFAIRAVESGNGASAKIAKVYDGIIRSIQNMSNFDLIVDATAHDAAAYGFDCWEIVADWADSDAFEQDLMFERVNEAVDRVWLGPHEKVDRSDCREGFKLTKMAIDDYERDFPDGGKQSVDIGREECDGDSDDSIVIGEYYCLKSSPKELVLLSNDKVVYAEDYEKAAAEYEQRGVLEVRRKSRDVNRCYVRKFDGSGWLDEKENVTVFAYIPLVPIYTHFTVIGGKKVYFGIPEKLKDSQKVYNYATSRDISDGALAPVEKIAMTDKQAAGNEAQNSQLNNSTDPIFYYNPDPQAMTPPYKLAASQPNMGLIQTQEIAAQNINEISKSFDPSRGQGMSNHSGVAYEILNNKASMSSAPVVSAIEVACAHAGKILIDAAPRVYDTRSRQVRVMNEDGTSALESINDEIMKDGKLVVVNDLSQGQYGVAVTSGKSFASRKTEGFKTMQMIGQLMPEVIMEGADIFIKAADAPYLDQIGERIRAQMIKTGRIPESQLTDEERQKITQEMEQAQAAQRPDPTQTAAVEAMQAQTAQAMQSIEESRQKMELDFAEQMRKIQETQAKIENMAADTHLKQADTAIKLSQDNSR